MQNLLQKNNAKTSASPQMAPPLVTPRSTATRTTNILDSKYTHFAQQIEIKKKPLNSPSKSVSFQPSLKTPGHFGLFFLAVIGYMVIGYIFLKVDPTSIQHVLIPNSYLPLLGIFLLTNFFFFSFLLNNSRRGFLIALIVTTYLFLQLQTLLTPLIAVSVAIPFLFYESVMSLFNRKRT